MHRVTRVVAVGAPHHVTQWGIDRQQIFFTDFARPVYIQGDSRHHPTPNAKTTQLDLHLTRAVRARIVFHSPASVQSQQQYFYLS